MDKENDLRTSADMVARAPLPVADDLTASAAIARTAPDRLIFAFGDGK